MSVYASTLVGAVARGGQKLELQSQVFLSHLMLVLGI